MKTLGFLIGALGVGSHLTSFWLFVRRASGIDHSWLVILAPAVVFWLLILSLLSLFLYAVYQIFKEEDGPYSEEA